MDLPVTPTPDASLADVAAYEADSIVQASRAAAHLTRQRIQMEEERLDRIELSIFRRVSFLHNSVSSTQ